MSDVAAIVLAAGLSRRMGNMNKLLQIVDGEALVKRVVRVCAAVSNHPVTVVTSYEKTAVESVLADWNVNFVTNAGFEKGQMTSVDTGLHGAPEACTYLLALGDQPYLSKECLIDLLAAHDAGAEARITVPFVNGARGNPIVIPAAQRARMLADPINLGCRRLTRTSPDIVYQFVTQDQSFVVDIDTPGDLARIREES